MNGITRAMGIGILVLSSGTLLHHPGARAAGTGRSCITLGSPVVDVTGTLLSGATYACATDTPLPGNVYIYEDGNYLASVLSQPDCALRGRCTLDTFGYLTGPLTPGSHTFTIAFSPTAVGYEDATATEVVSIP
jgi:hypothetical protein